MRFDRLSNRLVCFSPLDTRGAAFLELLSIDDPSTASPTALNSLGANYGPVAALVASGDALAFARHIDDGRIEPREIRREWTVNGATLDILLTTLNVPQSFSPLGWAAIQFKTPEHYRLPQFIKHQNGAMHLRAIIAVAERPMEVARHFRELWGGVIATAAEFINLRIGAGQLQIYSPQAIADQYGIGHGRSESHLVGAMLEVPTLQVPTLPSFAGAANPSSASFRSLTRRVYVPPALACGCLLVFVPPGNIVSP